MRTVVIVAIALPALIAGLGCLDDSGNPVDWYVGLKHSGTTQYFYADANSDTFVLSKEKMDNPSTGAPVQTIIAGLAANYALYNDQVPNDGPNNDKFGHTKGMVGISTDATTGFWLIHSVPQWAGESNGKYSGYPESGIEYGQSFLCMSLSASTLEKLTTNFELNRPQVYDVSFSTKVGSALPGLYATLKEGAYYAPSGTNITSITTVGGQAFTIFGKNTAWNSDLYSALVAPYYNEDIWVESWLNGAGDLENYCKPTYKQNTYNIETYTVLEYAMNEGNDHSKFAVLPSSKTLCIGDINRQSGQFKRGGGTACFTATSLFSQLYAKMSYWTTAPRGGCAK